MLHHDGKILLAVHSRFWAKKNRRWGLPGGNIEWREDPAVAARREIEEEFDLYLNLNDMQVIGAYAYKGRDHMVYGAEVDYPISEYDRRELVDIGWFTPNEIKDLSLSRRLHAGYELDAISTYLMHSKSR